jgi:hypothetical protein
MFLGFCKLAVVAGAALYTGLVLMSFRTDGPHHRPQTAWRHPVRSAERLLVWLGVKGLELAAGITTPIFAMLSEASADVGEWFLGDRYHEMD